MFGIGTISSVWKALSEFAASIVEITGTVRQANDMLRDRLGMDQDELDTPIVQLQQSAPQPEPEPVAANSRRRKATAAAE